MILLAVALGAYMLGSFPTAYLVSRWVAGVDVRTVSSGNVGATNASRVLGWKWATMILAVDLGKGLLAVWGSTRWSFDFEMWSFHPDQVRVLAAAAVILGHVFPVFLKGKGGKGVATSAGAFLMLAPMPTFMAVTIFALGVSLSHRISVGSIMAAVALPAALIVLEAPPLVQGFGGVAAMAVIALHVKNMKRLWQGTEPKIFSR